MSVHDISVRLLLVTDDLEAINFLTHILQRLAVTVEICPDMQAAAGKLCRAKFEAVIIDFTDQKAASELLQSVTESTAHKASVRFALLPAVPPSQRIPERRVHFFIRRPLSSVEVIRMFKAAYPLMVRERRRCFRCDLQVPVSLQRSSGSSLTASSANIQRGWHCDHNCGGPQHWRARQTGDTPSRHPRSVVARGGSMLGQGRPLWFTVLKRSHQSPAEPANLAE